VTPLKASVSWKDAVERRDAPSCLIFSRQNLPHQQRSEQQIADIARGGYVLRDTNSTPDAIIIATGSEVGLAMDAAEQLAGKGTQVRVVSMPSTNVFDAQDEGYRESVLPSSVTARVVVEAGIADGWYKYIGTQGKAVAMNTFGESAPAGELFKQFGFTVENVVAAVESAIS